MKLLKLVITITLLMVINASSAQTVAEKWKQLGDFHDLLTKTFTLSEEGNFKPIKLFSQDLVSKSEALDPASMPQDLRSSRLEEVLIVLKSQTKAVNELVKSKAPNAEIMRAFQNVHDIYNRVVYVCDSPKK